MRFRLFAIERDGHVALGDVGERDRGCGGQRDAFVGRPEQHVEGDAGSERRLRVRAPERGERRARIDHPGVEEIRTHAAGLEREFAEAQRVLGQGEVEERLLVGKHAGVNSAMRGVVLSLLALRLTSHDANSHLQCQRHPLRRE